MSERQPSSRSGAIRASDEDRERLIDALNEHAVAGRLTTEEFEERVSRAYAARTTGELDALRRDLPRTDLQTALEHRARRAHLTRRMVQETGGSLAAFVAATAVWAASGASGQFWPIWVLVVVVVSLVRNGWGLFGPAPDLDAVEAKLNAHRQHHRHSHGRHRSGRY